MFRVLSALSVLFFCPAPLAGQGPNSSAVSVSDTLLARAQEWVDSWNDKDVKRMRRLHADDVSAQLYGLGDEFTTIEGLLKEASEKNFWNLTWSIKIVDPHVRMLGAHAALVAFRLVGSETPSGGTAHPVSGAISLVFQRVRREWLVVHVHDSSPPPPKSDTR